MTSRAARRLALVALAIGVSGCGGDGDTGVEYPPTHGVFDYQLGGTYGRISTPDGESRIDIVVRDSTEEPLVGAYNVCYINGFQTQPGDEAVWLGERADALLLDSAGRPVIDPDWPDEYVLDPSTREQREVILGAVVLPISGRDDFVSFNAANEVIGNGFLSRINLDLRENSGMNELKDTLAQMAAMQQELIKGGVTTKAIAEQRIIDVESN